MLAVNQFIANSSMQKPTLPGGTSHSL